MRFDNQMAPFEAARSDVLQDEESFQVVPDVQETFVEAPPPPAAEAEADAIRRFRLKEDTIGREDDDRGAVMLAALEAAKNEGYKAGTPEHEDYLNYYLEKHAVQLGEAKGAKAGTLMNLEEIEETLKKEGALDEGASFLKGPALSFIDGSKFAKAVRAEQKLEADQAEETKELLQEQMRTKAAAAEQQRLLNEARREASEEAVSSIQASMQELNTLKINPFRIYENGLAAIGAAIATAIGAYAQGISPGKIPNTALQILNKAEEMDLKAQQAEYNNAENKITIANNLYGKLMNKYNDESRVLAEYRAITGEYMAHELNRLKISQKTEAGRIQAELLIAENDINVKKANNAFALNVYNSKLKAKAMELRSAAGAAKSTNIQENARAGLSRLKQLRTAWELYPEKDDQGRPKMSLTAMALMGLSQDEGNDVKRETLRSLIPDKELIAIESMNPLMGISLFEIIRSADPSGKISNQDANFFKALTMNVGLINNPVAFEARLRTWEKILGTLSDPNFDHSKYRVMNEETGKMETNYRASGLFKDIEMPQESYGGPAKAEPRDAVRSSKL